MTVPGALLARSISRTPPGPWRRTARCAASVAPDDHRRVDGWESLADMDDGGAGAEVESNGVGAQLP